MSRAVERFRLAPMSRLILTLTIGLLTLPILFLVGTAFERALAIPAMLLVAVYSWVWLRFRPTRFVVHPELLEVVWPLKRRALPRDEIAKVSLIDGQELRSVTGWCVRVGAGGLWGAFGWLWTSRLGVVQMYISRTGGFVWIECRNGRPWLITPEQPEAFVRALADWNWRADDLRIRRR